MKLNSSSEDSPVESPLPQVKKSAFAKPKIRIQLNDEEASPSFGDNLVVKTDSLIADIQDTMSQAESILDSQAE